MKPRTQSEHERYNRTHYPGTRQMCTICNEPTERCEEDGIWSEQFDGWICPECDGEPQGFTSRGTTLYYIDEYGNWWDCTNYHFI